MKFTWHSDKGRAPDRKAGSDYLSETVMESQSVPGVRLTISKMSFGRRVELIKRVRDLARRSEFLAASEDAGDKLDGALLRTEIDRLYVMWGVKAVAGLTVDGHTAGPELLVEEGPEELFREALAAVRRETGLSEEERKNS